MSIGLQILAGVGTLMTLAALGGATWAVIRASAQDATIKRQRGEIDDYLKRLNYIEPRVEALERENETLRSLRDPSEAIADLKEQEQRNHDATLKDLGESRKEIVRALVLINENLRGTKP